MKIVETDNFGGDYPDEKFVELPSIRTKEKAQRIADAINKELCEHDDSRRYWVVVEDDYKLQPGFTP